MQRPVSWRSSSSAKTRSALSRKSGGAVGVAAGSAAGDVGAPPRQAGAVARLRAAVGQALEGVGDRAQAEEAWPALAGALGRQPGQDASRLPDAARGLAEHPEDAGADRARSEARIVAAEREAAEVRGVQPRRAVAAGEEGPGAVDEAPGPVEEVRERAPEGDLVDARPLDGATERDERRPGAGRRPDGPEPVRRRGARSAPGARASRRCRRTSAGSGRRARTAAAGRSPGPRGRPLRAAITAVSWPLTYPSAVPARASFGPPSPRRDRSASARLSERHACRSEAFTTTIASSAPTARAATTAPSITRCGAWARSTRSLRLAGSPSAPLPTTIARRRRPATARSFMAVETCAPPRPRRPLRSTASRSAPASPRRAAGSGPCRSRCSASVSIAPLRMPRSRRSAVADAFIPRAPALRRSPPRRRSRRSAAPSGAGSAAPPAR